MDYARVKLGIVEGVQAQMGLDVGTKEWIQQQVPSWENVTVDAYLCGPHLHLIHRWSAF